MAVIIMMVTVIVFSFEGMFGSALSFAESEETMSQDELQDPSEGNASDGDAVTADETVAGRDVSNESPGNEDSDTSGSDEDTPATPSGPRKVSASAKPESGYTWQGTDAISSDRIYSGFGDALNFAVFARTFDNNQHMEGNIAVEKLTGCSGQFGNTAKVPDDKYTNYKITVTKKLSEAASRDMTFTFGTFTKCGSNYNSTGTTFTIKVPAGKTEASGVITGNFCNNQSIYVFELDANGKPVTGNAENVKVISGDNTEFNVTYTQSGPVVGGTAANYGNTSYVKHLTGTGSNILNKAGLYGRLILDDQDGVYIEPGNGGSDQIIRNNKGAYYTIQGASDYDGKAEIARNGSFPIDFDKTFSSLEDLSRKLAKAKTSNDVEVLNIVAAKNGNGNFAVDFHHSVTGSTYDDQNYLANTGLSGLGSSMYQVINVDLTNYKYNNKDNPYLIPQYKMPSGGGATWNNNASRIIFNFVQKNANGEYDPYTGYLTFTDTAGLMLAPKAKIPTMTNLNGAIYANDVKHGGGEIHKVTINKDKTAYGEVKVTNTAKTRKYMVKIKKTYDEEWYHFLEGADLEITRDGKVVDGLHWTSGTWWKEIWLEPGTYTLREIAAPDGYVIAEPIEFTIRNDGRIVIDGHVKNDDCVQMIDWPSEAEAGLEARKILVNGTLEEGQFGFDLTAVSYTDANGNKKSDIQIPMPEVSEDREKIDEHIIRKTNDGSGKIEFGNIKFAKPGTYTYSITEYMPDGITEDHPVRYGVRYDTTKYFAEVKVTAGEKGKLSSEVKYYTEGSKCGKCDCPEFTNEFIGIDMPESGSNSRYIFKLMGLVLMIAGGIYLHKLSLRTL